MKKISTSGWTIESIPAMQVAVFVMCGGGMVGRSAAESPEGFYIDDRVTVRMPYSQKKIYKAVKTLAAIATANGLNPRKLPQMPNFHNMEVF